METSWKIFHPGNSCRWSEAKGEFCQSQDKSFQRWPMQGSFPQDLKVPQFVCLFLYVRIRMQGWFAQDLKGSAKERKKHCWHLRMGLGAGGPPFSQLVSRRQLPQRWNIVEVLHTCQCKKSVKTLHTCHVPIFSAQRNAECYLTLWTMSSGEGGWLRVITCPCLALIYKLHPPPMA